jgi:hypothetical protein
MKTQLQKLWLRRGINLLQTRKMVITKDLKHRELLKK